MKYRLTREPITAGAVTTPEVVEGNCLFAECEGVTVFMILDDHDRDLFDNLPHRSRKTVLVQNLITLQYVRVKRAPCGLGCYCAAKIVSA